MRSRMKIKIASLVPGPIGIFYHIIIIIIMMMTMVMVMIKTVILVSTYQAFTVC